MCLCFSDAFRFSFWSPIMSKWIITCIGVILIKTIVLEFFWASKICGFIVFIKFGNTLAIISLSTFSVTLSLLRVPVIHIKGHLKVVPQCADDPFFFFFPWLLGSCLYPHCSETSQEVGCSLCRAPDGPFQFSVETTPVLWFWDIFLNVFLIISSPPLYYPFLEFLLSRMLHFWIEPQISFTISWDFPSLFCSAFQEVFFFVCLFFVLFFNLYLWAFLLKFFSLTLFFFGCIGSSLLRAGFL